ncbi:MAG: hypothetical protein PHV80_04490 [Rugosibacter sp.]|nr:hypothetical protein [Rugosibacter sp.]
MLKSFVKADTADWLALPEASADVPELLFDEWLDETDFAILL